MKRVLIYKRTHTDDPDRLGQFGINDCMGKVRDRDFDAVIGIGGISAQPRSKNIEPALFATYLSNAGRNGEAVAFCQGAYTSANMADRPYLLNVWAISLQNTGGSVPQALALYRAAGVSHLPAALRSPLSRNSGWCWICRRPWLRGRSHS